MDELRKQYPLASKDPTEDGYEAPFTAWLSAIDTVAYVTVNEDLARVAMDKPVYPVDDPLWKEKYPDIGIDFYYVYSIHIDEMIVGKAAEDNLVLVISEPLLRRSIIPKRGDRLIYNLGDSADDSFLQGFRDNVKDWRKCNPKITANGSNLRLGVPIFYITSGNLILSAWDSQDMKDFDLMKKDAFTRAFRKLWTEAHKSK